MKPMLYVGLDVPQAMPAAQQTQALCAHACAHVRSSPDRSEIVPGLNPTPCKISILSILENGL